MQHSWTHGGETEAEPELLTAPKANNFLRVAFLCCGIVLCSQGAWPGAPPGKFEFSLLKTSQTLYPDAYYSNISQTRIYFLLFWSLLQDENAGGGMKLQNTSHLDGMWT